MDIVVTVPKTFTHPCAPGKQGLAAWIAEGDPAGGPWSGTYWEFTTFGLNPDISWGERVYVVCEGRLRGYAPLWDIEFDLVTSSMGHITLVRGAGAVAVTIPDKIIGFQGWRKRWWPRSIEIPFPDWKGEPVPVGDTQRRLF